MAAQNKIATSVSALVDNIISPTDKVVCIDTKNSRIGVNVSSPFYEIDVSGTINSSIFRTANTTIDNSGITTINSKCTTSDSTSVRCQDISTSFLNCISGSFTNLTSIDISCTTNLYVKSIRPILNNDISINGNVRIDGSLNSPNLYVRVIYPFISGGDISINTSGNIWIDGSLNIRGTGTTIVGSSVGTGYITLRSDDRLKHNEQNIVNALLAIRQLKPQIYQKTSNFKELHYRGELNEPYIIEAGLIAQDVQQIEELKFSVINGNEQTPYSLNYNSIFIYCLAALKELDNNVETIKNVLNFAEATNNATTNNATTNYDLFNIINKQNIQIQELINKISILENRITTIERAF
jgi:hypothetical protein